MLEPRANALPPGLLVGLGCLIAIAAAGGPAFRLPTDNHAILDADGGARFFAPTPGKSWTAGQFGCVRSEGMKLHEGVDILAMHRDRRGEPTDDVHASADGEVAYVNRRPALSNYGNYIVVRHRIDGLEIFTLYAHLAEARASLHPGVRVAAGETIGRMGRTTNTQTPITRDRAHVHFEVDLLLNEHFSAWLKRTEPGARDDHGPWNGRNLAGLDPGGIFRLQAARGADFRLLDFVRSQRALCQVLVADTSFPWLHRYPVLIRRNPRAEQEGIAGYEISLNFSGVPFQAVPRARSEISGSFTTRLLRVDEEEQRRNPCRRLVFKRGQSWTLTASGQELLSLLTQ